MADNFCFDNFRTTKPYDMTMNFDDHVCLPEFTNEML